MGSMWDVASMMEVVSVSEVGSSMWGAASMSDEGFLAAGVVCCLVGRPFP